MPKSIFGDSVVPFKWSSISDALLSELVTTHVVIKKSHMTGWTTVASELYHRLIESGIDVSFASISGKQCRERWVEQLDPSKNREPFTDEEQIYILRRKKNGGSFADIATELNRPGNMVKNHYYALIKSDLYKGIRKAAFEESNDSAAGGKRSRYSESSSEDSDSRCMKRQRGFSETTPASSDSQTALVPALITHSLFSPEALQTFLATNPTCPDDFSDLEGLQVSLDALFRS